MVLAERTAERNISRVFGPASRPIQPWGMPPSSVAEPIWLEELCQKIFAACVGQAHIGILVEFVRRDIIHGENELHIIFSRLFYECFDLF